MLKGQHTRSGHLTISLAEQLKADIQRQARIENTNASRLIDRVLRDYLATVKPKED